MKQSFLNLRSFTMLKGALMTGLLVFGLASCSEKDMPNAPEEEEGVESIAGINVNVINDADELSKYVTNYKKSGSRAVEILEHAVPAWKMPDLPTSFDGMTEVEANPYWNGYKFEGNTNFYVAVGDELNFEGGLQANNQCNIYIYGKLTIPAFAPAQGANIYIAPGGKLELTGKAWDGSLNGVLTNDTPTNLYIYEGGTYVGSYTSASKTGLYVEGDVNVGDATLSGTVRIGGQLSAGKLETNKCNFYADAVTADSWLYTNNSTVNVASKIDIDRDVTINAQNVIETEEYYVGGDFHMEDNSKLYAYSHLNVVGSFEDSTQGIVYTPCLYVKKKLHIKNSGTLNIPNYIYCDSLEASASGFKINMGGNALFHAVKSFTIQNKDWSITFYNDKANQSAIVTEKFEIMEGAAAYIHGFAYLSANEYWGKPSEETKYYVTGDDSNSYNVQENVKVTFDGVKINSKDDECTPDFTIPNSETPPEDTELISSIKHTHDISATCVALYNGKAYLSWHKRGTSIHGCLEALKVENDLAQLTSWMEVNDGNVEGDNNWNGNSSVDHTAENQGQYDFNHLIVAENRVVTVGDNAKMGGFIGSIPLDPAGDFGTNGELQAAFSARQLLGKEDTIIGRSGNAVLYANGKYYIACAGGFQEYEGKIEDLAIKVTNSKGNEVWKNFLGAYDLTAGSAKHIATNGNQIATLELISKGSHAEGDDYWFNDTETAIAAVLKVRNANDWLNSVVWSANIGNIAPIYGKNSIAIDETGNVYVAAGKQGLLVYKDGNKVSGFSIAAKEPKAGANGVAIDSKYVYVAYGVGGLYILNKSDLSVVSWYKSNAPEGYETEAAAASANYVAVDGQYIYVAYGRHGVKVLKLND